MNGGRAVALFVAGQIFMGAAACTLWFALSPRIPAAAPVHVYLHTQEDPPANVKEMKKEEAALPSHKIESALNARQAPIIRPLIDAILDGRNSRPSVARAPEANSYQSEYVLPSSLNGALARNLRERIGAVGENDTTLSESLGVASELQPLLEQFAALRGQRNLADFAGNPEVFEPLGMAIEDIAGLLESLQGGAGMGGGMSMSGGAGESLTLAIEALSMVEDILAELEDGLFKDSGSGEEALWGGTRLRGLLFWLLMRNNEDGGLLALGG